MALRIENISAEMARPFLAKAQAFDISGGAVSQAENEIDCVFFGVHVAGGPMVGAFSARFRDGEMVIVQAGADWRERNPLAGQVMASIEHAARAIGVRVVRFFTVRRGLVRLMESRGFIRDGLKMEKVLA